MISQFSPILIDAIDSFHNNQDDICVTKSDLKVHPAVVDSEVGPAVVDNNERYRPKPTGIKCEEYRSNLK